MSALTFDKTHERAYIAQAPGVGLGVCELTSPATSGEFAMLRGDHAALDRDAADGLWLTAKIAPRSTSSIFVEVGFCDADRTDYARLLFDTDVDASNWRLECRDNSSQNFSTLAESPAADTFVTVDMVLAATFVACSLDGSGFTGGETLVANLPVADLTPYVLVGTRTSATKSLYVEAVSLVSINGEIAHPTEHDLLV